MKAIKTGIFEQFFADSITDKFTKAVVAQVYMDKGLIEFKAVSPRTSNKALYFLSFLILYLLIALRCRLLRLSFQLLFQLTNGDSPNESVLPLT